MADDLEQVKVFVWPPGPYRYYTPALMAEVHASKYQCVTTAQLQCPLCGTFTYFHPETGYGNLQHFGPGRQLRFNCADAQCIHTWEIAYEDDRLWLLKEGLA